MKNIITFSLLIFVFLSCEQDKELEFIQAKLDFVYEGTDENQELIDIKELVSFENKSENCTNFKWFFGDGDSSVAFSPSHFYKNSGVYNVSLTAQNEKGELIEITKKVLVSYRVFKTISIESTEIQHFNEGLILFAGEINTDREVYFLLVDNVNIPNRFPYSVDFFSKEFLSQNEWYIGLIDSRKPHYNIDESDTLIFGINMKPLEIIGEFDENLKLYNYYFKQGRNYRDEIVTSFTIKIQYYLVEPVG